MLLRINYMPNGSASCQSLRPELQQANSPLTSQSNQSQLEQAGGTASETKSRAELLGLKFTGASKPGPSSTISTDAPYSRDAIHRRLFTASGAILIIDRV